MSKRFFDIIFSIVALAILMPAFLVVMLLIGIISGPPVFFRQSRVGKGGRAFTLYKFRSMTNAEGPSTSSFPLGNRARVTSVGRVLRKYKIDEWPQLFNVLRGDMSIVGPRPEVEEWTSAYPERWAVVLGVKPGITDPASIQYLKEEDILADVHNPVKRYREFILPDKLSIYEEYIRTYSLAGDLRIILRTVTSLLRI